ncbi:hypothetical protein PCE1_003004 [Barthelona sp. PCE]
MSGFLRFCRNLFSSDDRRDSVTLFTPSRSFSSRFADSEHLNNDLFLLFISALNLEISTDEEIEMLARTYFEQDITYLDDHYCAAVEQLTRQSKPTSLENVEEDAVVAQLAVWIETTPLMLDIELDTDIKRENVSLKNFCRRRSLNYNFVSVLLPQAVEAFIETHVQPSKVIIEAQSTMDIDISFKSIYSELEAFGFVLFEKIMDEEETSTEFYVPLYIPIHIKTNYSLYGVNPESMIMDDNINIPLFFTKIEENFEKYNLYVKEGIFRVPADRLKKDSMIATLNSSKEALLSLDCEDGYLLASLIMKFFDLLPGSIFRFVQITSNSSLVRYLNRLPPLLKRILIWLRNFLLKCCNTQSRMTNRVMETVFGPHLCFNDLPTRGISFIHWLLLFEGE